MNAAGSIVTVKANGYLTRFKSVHVKRNEVSKIDVILKPSNDPIQITSERIMVGDLSMELNSLSSFEYEDGTDFTGTPLLSFEWIDQVEKFNSFPLSLKGYFNQTWDNQIFPIRGMKIQVADLDGKELFLKEGARLKIDVPKFTNEHVEAYDVNLSKEIWQPIDLSEQQNSYQITLNKIGDVIFGKALGVGKINGKVIDENGLLIGNKIFKISTKGLDYEYQTDQYGMIDFSGFQGENYTLEVSDKCNLNPTVKSFFVPEMGAVDLGDIKTNFGSTGISFKVFNCDLSPYSPKNGLMVEIETENEIEFYRFEDNDVKIEGQWCENAIKIRLKDGVETLEEISDFRINLQEENDLYRVYLCDPSIGGFIAVDEEIEYTSSNSLIIKTESAGIYDPLTFTDLSEFTMSVNEVNSTGVYMIDELDMISPALLKCNGNCTDLFMQFTVFGDNKDDKIIAHIYGNIDGKKVKGYFNGLKFN